MCGQILRVVTMFKFGTACTRPATALPGLLVFWKPVNPSWFSQKNPEASLIFSFSLIMTCYMERLRGIVSLFISCCRCIRRILTRHMLRSGLSHCYFAAQLSVWSDIYLTCTHIRNLITSLFSSSVVNGHLENFWIYWFTPTTSPHLDTLVLHMVMAQRNLVLSHTAGFSKMIK